MLIPEHFILGSVSGGDSKYSKYAGHPYYSSYFMSEFELSRVELSQAWMPPKSFKLSLLEYQSRLNLTRLLFSNESS
jgi:hypothetical protein